MKITGQISAKINSDDVRAALTVTVSEARRLVWEKQQTGFSLKNSRVSWRI